LNVHVKIKYTISLICLLALIVLLVPVQSRAIDLFGSKQKTDPVDLLPEDLRGRWLSLLSQPDTSNIGGYLVEGKRVLYQLGKLVEVVGGEPPKPGDPSYPVYVGTLNKLVDLLDRIEMAAVISTTDDAQLEALRDSYFAEKDQLKEDIRADRRKMIELGKKRLNEHLTNPAYRQNPHKRAVIADLYFRLAELMLQEAEDEFYDQLDRKMELAKTDSDAAAALPEPVKDVSQVLEMYQHIIDEFPDTQFGVDALYNIALLRSESNDPLDKQTSNQYLETLVTHYPGNKYTLNALRRIGEYYFNPPVNEIEKAIEVFTRIARDYPNTPFCVEAIYHLGWSYYRISKIPTAVEYFAKTLDTDYAADGTKLEKTTVKDFSPDALRYLGICFSVNKQEWQNSGVDGLEAWLEDNPDRMRNYGADILITLGDIYTAGRGQYAEGVEVYEKFIEIFPLEPRAAVVQRKIVQVFLTEQIKDSARMVEEPIKFYDTYNPDSEWWAANDDPRVRNEVVPFLESYLDLIIDRFTTEGYNENNIEKLEKSVQYARQYLRFWPNGPNAYAIHSNLAWILYNKLNRPMEAMREYWQVAMSYTNKEDMEVACETVVLIAMDFARKEKEGLIYVSDQAEILPPEAAPEKPIGYTEPDTVVTDTAAAGGMSMTPDVKRTPLLNSEKLELSAFDLYDANFPEGKLREIILYTAGNFLYEHDWIVESRQYFEKLIAEFPKTKFFESAYTALLDGYFRMVDMEGVEDVAARIEAADVSDELKQAAYKRKAVAIFRNAAAMQQQDDHVGAADEFMRVALATPDWDEADRALFQAGQEYAKGEAFEKSNEAYLMLVERYPESGRADKALMNTAYNFQNELGQLDQAAAVFERLAEEYPNSELVQDALANASINYNKVDDHLSVIRVNEKFLSLYPDDPEADIYLFEMAGHYLKLDDLEQANKIYLRFAEKYPDDPRTIRAYFERGSYYLTHNEQSLAAQEFRQAVDANDRQVAAGGVGAPNYAAKALSRLLEWEHEEYDKLRFTVAGDTTARVRKREWRDSLIAKYRRLIQLSQKEAWQAFYEIGRLVEEQAVATFEQAIPYFPEQEKRFEALDQVVDEAIILNQATLLQYKDGYTQLDRIEKELIELRDSTSLVRDRLKNWVRDTQSDTSAAGQSDSVATMLADSTKRLTIMDETLAELDSSRFEARKWADACRDKIPEIAVRNGDYLLRSYEAKFAWENPERIPEIRLLFQEEILKNILTPLAPEVCGLYLQALGTVAETGVNVDYWNSYLEERFTHAIDTLLAQWDNQFTVSISKIDGYIEEYSEMLPKGETAESREGFLPDMMGSIILTWIDYLNVHNLDKLNAFSTLLDTVVQYDRPIGFGDRALEKPLEYILEQYDRFDEYSRKAREKSEEYAREYEENGYYWDDEIEEEVERYWYNDAAASFEDIAITCTDYGVGLLEEGLNLRDRYELPGMAGINILRKLVKLQPDVYASKVGIEPQYFTITSSTDWLIWPEYETDFETADFDDSNWEHARVSSFPAGTDFGVLDSLGATAIWFELKAPPALPQWREYPEEVSGLEGELIEFTVAGVAPERKAPGVEDTTLEAGGEGLEGAATEEGEAGQVIETPETPTTEPSYPEAEKPSAPPPQLRIEYSSDDLPGDAVFSDHGDGTGTFSWTPSFSAQGEYTARFTLYNYDIPVAIEVPITVGDVDRGFNWIEFPQRIDSEEGLTVSFRVAGEDPDGDPLTITYSSFDIPGTADFVDNGDDSGQFTWETSYDDSGSYTASFELSDGDTVLALDIPIRIENAVRSPRWIDYPGEINTVEGSVIEFTVTASSPDGLPPALSDQSIDLPESARFTDQGDGTGTFYWETTFEDSGSYNLVLELTNVDTSVSLEIPIRVEDAVRAPRWVDLPERIDVEEGDPVEFTVAGMHPDGKALTITYFSEDIPEDVVEFSDAGDGSGQFIWPTEQGDAGAYIASFALSDRDTTIIGEVPITIGGAAQPPKWTDIPDNITGEAGSVVEFTMSGADPAGGAVTIEYASDDLPGSAQFTDFGDGSGSFSWQTTDADAGEYAATFTISNGVLATDKTVQITVTGRVVSPEWLDVPEQVSADAGDLIEFALSGTNPGGEVLTLGYSSDNIPESAQFEDHGDGSGAFTWQTTVDDAGDYDADFTLSNGQLSISATVPISVTAREEGPPEWIDAPADVTGQENSQMEFTVSGADPLGGDVSLTFSSPDLPEAARFIDNLDGSAVFSWLPTYLDAGDYSASFTLSNGLFEITREITITIENVDQPPEWIEIPPEISGNAGTLIEFTVFGVDYDGDDLAVSFSSDDLPATATFTDQGDGSGVFSWQTTAEDAGVYKADFLLQSNDQTVEGSVTVNVVAGE